MADAVLMQHGNPVSQVQQHCRHELLGEKLPSCVHLSDQAAQVSQLRYSKRDRLIRTHEEHGMHNESPSARSCSAAKQSGLLRAVGLSPNRLHSRPTPPTTLLDTPGMLKGSSVQVGGD